MFCPLETEYYEMLQLLEYFFNKNKKGQERTLLAFFKFILYLSDYFFRNCCAVFVGQYDVVNSNSVFSKINTRLMLTR